jgi:hypothetical protein
MKKNIEYTEEKLLFIKFIGGFILFMGLIFLFISPLFSIAFITIGFKLSSTKGFQIDFQNNKIRTTHNILFLDFGKWQAIPNFEYLTIYNPKEKTSIVSAINSLSVNTKKYKLNLFYNRNQKISLFKSKNKSLMLEIGEEVAKSFEIGFLDSINPTEQKWIMEPKK